MGGSEQDAVERWARRFVLLLIFPCLVLEGMVILTGLVLDRFLFRTRHSISVDSIKELKKSNDDSLVRPYCLGSLFYLAIFGLTLAALLF